MAAPPSDKFVVHVLAERGPLTRTELLEETGLAQATLDRAIARLVDRGQAERREDPDDARRTIIGLDRYQYENNA